MGLAIVAVILVAVLGFAVSVWPHGSKSGTGSQAASPSSQTPIASSDGSATPASTEPTRSAKPAKSAKRGTNNESSAGKSGGSGSSAKSSASAGGESANAASAVAGADGSSEPVNPYEGMVVVIDPGHQADNDMGTERLGPGTTVTGPKVPVGATGALAPHAESSIDLLVALKLREELRDRGVSVVMTRTKQDVQLSNAERSKIANGKHATLFVRLHCNGADGETARGISVVSAPKNYWTQRWLKSSQKARDLIAPAVIASTGAKRSKLVSDDDRASFNWAKVPTVLVELGNLSNPADDKQLVSSAYQRKVASGLARGITAFLRTR
jgi:N-acetylmuramoyl-L-alanine amidase